MLGLALRGSVDTEGGFNDANDSKILEIVPGFITAACKLFWVPFLPIFACRGGPGRRRRGRGPPRHAKIDFFLCPHGPLRKYFRSVFSACTDLYENIFEAFFLPARTITKHF